VQIGTPVELFDRPRHTFVGHFIGSPGMNILPADVADGRAQFHGHDIQLEGAIAQGDGRAEIGIRPEFVSLADAGLPAIVSKVSDVGRHIVVEARVGETPVKAITDRAPEPGAETFLSFQPDQTRLYRDGWIATSKGDGL